MDGWPDRMPRCPPVPSGARSVTPGAVPAGKALEFGTSRGALPMTRHLARLTLSAVSFSLLAAVPAAAQIDARMLRYPDVSATQIAFTYAGDIWIVPKTGGVAVRLSSPAGEETFPRFSPAGTTL